MYMSGLHKCMDPDVYVSLHILWPIKMLNWTCRYQSARARARARGLY